MMLKDQRYTFFNEYGQAEELLQAVVIADLFDEKLSPISQLRPVSLMPVANKCAIDYTIEMLLYSGLQRIMIIVSRHADQVVAHVKASTYFVNGYAEFEIVRLNPANCHSIGDALRELDRDPRSHLRGEFVIVSGVTIGKLNMRRLIERHLQRRLKDDRVILTAVFDRRPPDSPLKDSDRDVLLMSDPQTGEILHVEPHHRNRFPLRPPPIAQRPSVDVQFDLSYSGIYFLDVRALQLFGDNFDFQNVDELIRNIVGDEVLQKAVCFDVVGDGYMGSVRSFKLYHAISFDVVRRWSYPSTPDRAGCSLHSDHIYLGHNAVIHQSAHLRSDVVVGANTLIGHKVVLERCIIGDDCCIGSNVVIRDSIIWRHVRIEADCLVENSIICDDAVVLRGTELGWGCILSFNVTVGPGTVLPKRIVVHRSSTSAEIMATSALVDLGEAAKGSVYTVSVADLPHYEWGLPTLRGRKQPKLAEEAQENAPDDDYDFQFSVRDSVILGIDEQVPLDTIITEINVSKHLFNMSIDQVVLTVCDTMVEYCFPTDPQDPETVMEHIKKRSEQMAPFCRRYFHSENLQSSLLMRFEDHLYNSEALKQLYARFILQLYCYDIVDLGFLASWRDSEADSYDFERRQFRSDKIQGFLDWAKAKHLDTDDSDSNDSDSE